MIAKAARRLKDALPFEEDFWPALALIVYLAAIMGVMAVLHAKDLDRDLPAQATSH